jgi:hypothetical protein
MKIAVRLFSAILWVVSTIPYATLVVVAAFGIRARIEFGYWPIAYRDPIPATLYSHCDLATYAYVLGVFSLLPAIGLAILCILKRPRAYIWKQTLVLCTGYGLFSLWAAVDPFGFGCWFLD